MCLGLLWPFIATAGETADTIRIDLEAGKPFAVRWSPKLKPIHLKGDGTTWSGHLNIGKEKWRVRIDNAPDWRLRVWRSNTAPIYGTFLKGKVVRKPGTVWFELMLPPTQKRLSYPIQLQWKPQSGEARITRGAFRKGNAKLGDKEVRILIAEDSMDGLYGDGDTWFISDPKDDNTEYGPAQASDFFRVAKLNKTLDYQDQNWAIEDIDPAGTWVQLGRSAATGPDDPYAPDRIAARSGGNVPFATREPADTIRQAQASGVPALLYFTSDWCGPCRIMEKWVFTADQSVSAAESYQTVKIDIDRFPELKSRFEIYSVPVLIALDKEGAVRERHRGYASVSEFVSLLEKTPSR